MPPAQPTPSQTIGPFFGHALPFHHGDQVAPAGHPDGITVHGHVYDGAGDPVTDALLEFWQTPPDGSHITATGSMRRDPVTGGHLGRNGVDFTGFGRVATDAAGHYALHTLRPGGVPYLAVIVFARGLLHHLHTRAYLTAAADDPLLTSLEPRRRATLLATPDAGRPTAHRPDSSYRFDIRLQDDGTHEETVFLELD
ncbi:protocatechuate 3,4-dioxygenase subunit alpha [Kitasatospora sp. NPDC088346]|uniref:protocatechuate 3,4-dioxygenase subunit alpha n=1 Tax=Kitasatospora sp. NPDC088346 TaxID=3364073 RepID=UPI003822819E